MSVKYAFIYHFYWLKLNILPINELSKVIMPTTIKLICFYYPLDTLILLEYTYRHTSCTHWPFENRRKKANVKNKANNGVALLSPAQELQTQLEEEVRSHEEHREEQAALERRCVLLVGEGEETHAALDSAERARKALETELQEVNDKFSDLNNQVGDAAPL